jgi:hypothetical protein
VIGDLSLFYGIALRCSACTRLIAALHSMREGAAADARITLKIKEF